MNQNYVLYNDKEEISELDMNNINFTNISIKNGATGRHLYKSEPKQSYYICDGMRDPQITTIIGVDIESTKDLPDHSSRFGYGLRAPFGYGTGHWPGRYNTTIYCTKDDQPKNMAPERFYEKGFTNYGI